jgi:hypothetical protein
MSVMVQFSNPTYGGLKEPDPNPVVLGPYQEARVEDACVYGDGPDYSLSLGYYDCGENLWIRDGNRYSEMKIFAAPLVVSPS